MDAPLSDLLAEYAAQAAHTGEVVTSHDWDAESVHHGGLPGRQAFQLSCGRTAS